MNYIDFSTRIKKKYPQYGGMDDRELAQRIVAKYPQYDVSFEEEEATGEEAFQNWYNKASKEFNLDPNPDAPEHFYDYRSAFKAGAWPDETGHWPSEYKLEGHPRMVIDGVNTKTGERHIDASFQSETPDVVSTPALQGKQPSTSIAPYQGKKPQEMFAGTEDPFTQPEQKEEYKGNIFKDTYGSLEAGVANLASGIAKIPGALLDTYLTATNRFNKTINKATGANLKTDYKTPDIVYENGLTRFLEEDAKRHSLVTKKYQEKGEDLVSVISKGKVTDIAEYLYHSVLEQAPQLMGIAVAQMAGVPAWGTIGTLGGSSGAQKIDEIRKKVDSGELNTEKEVAILSGWINGLAEAGFEKMGSFKILEKLTSALKGAPKTVVANTLKNTFKGLLTGFAEEAKEEMATSITQNVVDYISGVNPDLTWEDIVREAFEEGTIGGLSGGVPGMAGGFAEGVSSRRIREGQTAQSQQAKTVRDNIRNVSEKEAAKTQHVPQREVEEGDTKKEPDRIYKEIPPSQPVLKSVVEKTEAERKRATEGLRFALKKMGVKNVKEFMELDGDEQANRFKIVDDIYKTPDSKLSNIAADGIIELNRVMDVYEQSRQEDDSEPVIGKAVIFKGPPKKYKGKTTEKYYDGIIKGVSSDGKRLTVEVVSSGQRQLRTVPADRVTDVDGYDTPPETFKVEKNTREIPDVTHFEDIKEDQSKKTTDPESQPTKEPPPTPAETPLQQKQADTVTDFVEKRKPKNVPPSGEPQTLADKGITEQQFFELPDEERHKVFRDLSEEEQDYLLQWDGETEREIAETIDRIKRSAEEQKEIDKIETEPSEAQKKAGNYPKAHIKRDGLDISIENAAGSERSGKDETGKEWKQTINHDYGYVKGTKGPDKDHVDVFIKPGSSEGGTVYVVNQVNPNTQKFDEPKCMMGFESEAEAKEAYLSNYEENWQGLGSITPMSMDVFKKWVYSKDAKKKSPVTVADLKKYEQVKPEPKKEPAAKKTETIQKEGLGQPSPEYSEDVIPKEDVPVIQIRKDEDKKLQQKMPGQGRKDMENRLGNIIGYSIIVADEKDLKESGTKEPLSQRDKRRERSYEDGRAVAKKLIEEIEGRNYAELVDRLSVLENKGSRAAFTAYTGIKLPKTVSGTKSVIRTFVGKDVYNKHLESIKKKKEEAAQKQKQKAIEERNERLKEEKVTDNGRLTNNFDLIHRLVEDEGYTRLEEEKKGIATHYLIHNDEKERYYRFRKKDHGDLIKELLEKQFGEVEITPPGVRVATKKDLDHLFGKDLKPEEKEKGTNKPADQNVVSLKQEEFNAKENTKENQADTKAIKETGRSVRTVTSTRGGSHPRRQAAVKRSQPDESYSVEYWQAQHLHNLNVSLYNALRFGWKDRKGKSHPGMQPGWINDFNILTDSNILGGRRGKNLSSNAQSYLQDLVDSFNESPEYLAELASLGLEQPEHIDDIRMWLEQSLSASEFVEYHKGYESDLVPQTDMNKFNEALEVFQEDHTKLTPEQRRVLEESWQMDLDDVIARENALQEQPGSAIDEMWGEEKAEDLFEGTELAGPVTRSETSTKKKPQYETGDLFEGTALQETELGKELVRRREKKDKIKERGAEGLPLFETPDESNQTSLFEQRKESSEKYVQESAKIEDFGEKIGGARKDYYADFVSNLNSAVSHDIADVPLSKSWPQPDYNKLLDEGKDKWAVAFFRAARDEIGTKPQRSYRIKSWAEKVRFLRDFATQVLNGDISKESLLEHLNQAKFSDLAKHLLGRIELYETFGHDKSLKGIHLTKNHYSLYKGQKNVDKWLVEKDAKATAFGNMPRTLGEGDTKQEAIESFRKSYDSLGEGKSSATKFVAYTKRGAEGVYIGVKIGKNYVDLKKFDTSKEALEYKKGNTGELQALLDKYKDIPSERREFNRERIGKDHRGGADATPEMFDNAFGFRGVEFGNWVKDSERQENLNQAYDALMDLSTILNIPSRAISLNGELGLAFGSRGRGGKGAPSAHYEPSKIVINLTKKNGPGSLAHEWWHALDNYLSRKKGRKDDFQTVSSHVPGNVPLRAELAAAVGNVVEAIKKTGIKKRSENLDRRRSTPYWSTTIEMTARAFENYVINKLADLNVTNDYLANVATNKEYSDEIVDVVLSGETPRAEDMYPYILPEEMGGVIEGFDNLFNTIKTRVEDSGDVAFYAKPDKVRGVRKPEHKFHVDVKPDIKKAVDAVELKNAVYPRYKVILEDGKHIDLWPEQPQTKKDAIEIYYKQAQDRENERLLTKIELEPERSEYNKIYNDAAEIIESNGVEADLSKKEIEDKEFNSSIGSIKNGELQNSLKIARIAIEYSKLGLNQAREYLDNAKRGILAANIYKMPEMQRGFAILKVLSSVFKKEGGEPKTFWTEFPNAYASELDRNLNQEDDDLDVAPYYNGETGEQWGEPRDVENRVREQHPELYKKALKNIERKVADIYAGSTLTGHFYGFANNDFIYDVGPKLGDDGGISHATTMAALSDVIEEIKRDDSLPKRLFEKYYVRPQKTWKITKSKPEKGEIDDIFGMFFGTASNNEYYVVEQDGKRISTTDVSDGEECAIVHAMEKAKKDGMKDVNPDWGMLYKDGNPYAQYAQSTPSEVTLLEEPSTPSEQTYSSTTEERLTTSIFRSEGKDPIPGSIRVIEDVAEGVQKDVTTFVEDVTGKKVVWVECDTGTLVDSLGFSIDGVSFPKSIHPDLANKIFIDVNTTRPVLWTAFHEFSHFLENSPEFKKRFWEVAKLTDSGLAQRAKMGDSEFSADIIGEMMSRPEFWENLRNYDRNLFDRAIKKIIEILSRLSRSLKKMLTGNEITEESRPAFERFIENSTELRNELAKALIDYNKAKGENVKETSNRLAAAVKSLSFAKSDQVTKWPVDTSGKKVDPTQLEEYDFDEPLTHESGSDFDGIINKEGIFNGVFTLGGLKGSALGSGGYHHTYIPRKDSVAREGSIDLDEERALDFIKNEYPDATQEQLEVIEAVAVRDKSLLDVVEDEYGEEDVVGFFNNLIYGDNAGEIEWVLQGLRGQIALDQGFDAIAMRDENGTSYLIPAGSKALYLGKVNSYDDLEKIKNSAENTKGAGQPLFAKKKPKEEFTERVSEAEKLERMTQKLRGKLRHLPKDQLKERAQIELSIQSAQAQELWHIKNAIYDYAKRIGLKGVPYNKVDALLKNTETVSQLKKVSETLDDVWNSHVKRSAVEKLLNVIEKEYTRLKAIRGKRVSTIDRDKNRELEAYLAGLMAEPDPEAMARLNDTMEYFLSYAPKEIRKNPNWREQFKGKNLSEKHLAEITEWIEGRGTFPVFLSKDIQKAFRSNIYAMDTEQIEKTIKDIEEIKKEGRTAKKEKIARETMVREANISSIVSSMGHEEDPRPQNLKNKDWRERKRLAEGIKKFGDNVLFENLRIERILNWLDGNNGLLWKRVFEPILKAEENEMVNLEKALTKFEQFHKKISTKEALSEVIGEIEVTYEVEPDKFKSENIKITADHGMFVYANSQNPGNLEHLEGTGYTKEHIAQITEALPEKYKNAVDDLITYFDEEQYPRTNVHFAEEHEVDMPKVHRYFPVRNLASERSANAAATSDILMRYGLNRASVKKGHTKTRVMSKAPFRNESYFETALQSIIDAEHYIAFNTPVREVSRYIYDPRIKDAIKEKSSAAYREIRKWIRDSSHGRIAPPETSLDNVANYIRNNYAVAVLGGNLITIMKQPASFSQGLHHIKKKKYAVKAAVDFLVETLKMASKVRNIKDLNNLENSLGKKVQEKSVMMRYRPKSVERYYAEQLEKGRFKKTLKIEGGWEKLREVMMSGIQAADMATTIVLWWGRYTEVLNNTTDEYVAIKAADELIRTTQPMGGLIHLPGSFRDPSAFKRAFSMFMNQRNQNFNMLFETATQWQSHGWSENAQRIVFYILVPSVLMFAASTGGKMPWDDPEGWVEYLLDIITGGIMYYNTLASAATKGATNIIRSLRGKRKDRFFNDFSNPVIDVVQDFNSLLANPNNVGRWIETGGKLTGFPAVTQTKRVVKSFKSAVESKDPKKLVWSDYALGENSIYDAMAWRLHKATKPEEKKIYAKWYKSLSPKKQEQFKEYSVRWRKKNK